VNNCCSTCAYPQGARHVRMEATRDALCCGVCERANRVDVRADVRRASYSAPAPSTATGRQGRRPRPHYAAWADVEARRGKVIDFRHRAGLARTFARPVHARRGGLMLACDRSSQCLARHAAPRSDATVLAFLAADGTTRLNAIENGLPGLRSTARRRKGIPPSRTPSATSTVAALEGPTRDETCTRRGGAWAGLDAEVWFDVARLLADNPSDREYRLVFSAASTSEPSRDVIPPSARGEAGSRPEEGARTAGAADRRRDLIVGERGRPRRHVDAVLVIEKHGASRPQPRATRLPGVAAQIKTILWDEEMRPAAGGRCHWPPLAAGWMWRRGKDSAASSGKTGGNPAEITTAQTQGRS